MTSVNLGDGKYTYINDEQGQRALRYGEPWRNLAGDKFVYCMAAEIESLRAEAKAKDERIQQLEAEIDGLHLKLQQQSQFRVKAQADGLKLVETLTSKDAHIQKLEAALKLANYALLLSEIGSCTCCTKSHEIQYHSTECRFREIGNALASIRETGVV